MLLSILLSTSLLFTPDYDAQSPLQDRVPGMQDSNSTGGQLPVDSVSSISDKAW